MKLGYRRMRLEVLWHKVRRHQVVFGGKAHITKDLGGGGFSFVLPPVYRCLTCGVEWEGATIPVGDFGLTTTSLGFKRRADDE